MHARKEGKIKIISVHAREIWEALEYEHVKMATIWKINAIA